MTEGAGLLSSVCAVFVKRNHHTQQRRQSWSFNFAILHSSLGWCSVQC